jgi:hypothetical protein
MNRQTFIVGGKSPNYDRNCSRGISLMSPTGEIWLVGCPVIFEPEVGERLAVNVVNGTPLFHEFGFQNAERMPARVPPMVVKEIKRIPDPNESYHVDDTRETPAEDRQANPEDEPGDGRRDGWADD